MKRMIETLHGAWVAADLIAVVSPRSRAMTYGEQRAWGSDHLDAADEYPTVHLVVIELADFQRWNADGGDPGEYVVWTGHDEEMAGRVLHMIVDWLTRDYPPVQGLSQRNISHFNAGPEGDA